MTTTPKGFLTILLVHMTQHIPNCTYISNHQLLLTSYYPFNTLIICYGTLNEALIHKGSLFIKASRKAQAIWIAKIIHLLFTYSRSTSWYHSYCWTTLFDITCNVFTHTNLTRKKRVTYVDYAPLLQIVLQSYPTTIMTLMASMPPTRGIPVIINVNTTVNTHFLISLCQDLSRRHLLGQRRPV